MGQGQPLVYILGHAFKIATLHLAPFNRDEGRVGSQFPRNQGSNFLSGSDYLLVILAAALRLGWEVELQRLGLLEKCSSHVVPFMQHRPEINT